jgi:hypothetical protein
MLIRFMNRAAIMLALTFPFASPAQSNADEDSSFYRSKTLTYIVATAPGGSYDFYGRLVARHLPNHLPGLKVVVRNVPGQDHAFGANLIYDAKPDGLTIGTFSPALLYDQLIGRTTVRFDLGKMSWIGNAGADPRIMVVGSNSPIHTIQDLHKPGDPFLFAVSRIGSVNYNETKILQAILGFNAQIIIGYKRNDDQLAIQDRSIDAVFGPQSLYGPFVTAGFGRTIFQVGGENSEVPHLSVLIKNGNQDARDVVALMQAQANLAHLTAGPPEIPSRRLEALRNAYRQALSSHALQAEAAAAGFPASPYVVGDTVDKAIAGALEQSSATINTIAQTFALPPPMLVARAPKMKAVP